MVLQSPENKMLNLRSIPLQSGPKRCTQVARTWRLLETCNPKTAEACTQNFLTFATFAPKPNHLQNPDADASLQVCSLPLRDDFGTMYYLKPENLPRDPVATHKGSPAHGSPLNPVIAVNSRP